MNNPDVRNGQALRAMAQEMLEELETNILHFWSTRMCRPGEPVPGRISGYGEEIPGEPLGAVMVSRMLWAFSAAYRVLRRESYLECASRMKQELEEKFIDPEYGGVYWSVDSEGRPLDTKKQIYALGFAIYGLSEYARATGDSSATGLAADIYRDIEKYSADPVRNGYFEALSRDWKPLGDVRLSEKDANEHKTMNTHLHIIEPYANLYRVWPDEGLRERILNLLDILSEKIMDPSTGHLRLFFDDDWNSRHEIVSYGHDIEASWLIDEAAHVAGGDALREKYLPVVKQIADAASEGYIPGGGMIYEFHGETGAVDADRHWWVQAETVVGYLNLYQLTGDEKALGIAEDVWKFIRTRISDREGGEWFWSLKADGTPDRTNDKAGFWKCPYHNSRMCLEVIERNDLRLAKEAE